MGGVARDISALFALAARDPLREALDALDPDELTPRAALEALYRLKSVQTNG